VPGDKWSLLSVLANHSVQSTSTVLKEHFETYFFGAPHAFEGSIYDMVGKVLFDIELPESTLDITPNLVLHDVVVTVKPVGLQDPQLEAALLNAPIMEIEHDVITSQQGPSMTMEADDIDYRNFSWD
jgi:hypothetical protein